MDRRDEDYTRGSNSRREHGIRIVTDDGSDIVYERRQGGDRRRNEEDMEISDFKITLRDVLILLVAVISIATTLLHFKESLEKAQSEMTLKHELAATKITTLENAVARLENKTDSIDEHANDLERTVTQMYNLRKE